MPNPPRKLNVDWPFPSIIANTVAVERIARNIGNTNPLQPGTAYKDVKNVPGTSAADVALYAGKLFLSQKMTEDSQWIDRYWGDSPTSQDTYNYDIEAADFNWSYPVFKRRYLELRDGWIHQLARGPNSVFTGVYSAYVTVAGSNYVNPAVGFSGGGGTGAAAVAITDGAGHIIRIQITSEGSGYTSAPAIAITDAVGGGAAATSVIQPTGCQLVSEKVVAASEQWGSLYIMVERIYETLAGPASNSYATDPETMCAITNTNQRIATSTVTEPTGATGRTLEYDEENSAVTTKKTSQLDLTQLSGYMRTNWETDRQTQVPKSTTFTRFPNSSVAEPTTALGQSVTIERKPLLIAEKAVTQIDTTKLEAYSMIFPERAQISFPRVLTGLSIVWNTSATNGGYSETANGAAVGTSVSLALSVTGDGQGSATVTPELLPVWAPRQQEALPVFDDYCFLPNGFTITDILNKSSADLTAYLGTPITVSEWPVFKTVGENFVLTGQKVAVSARAAARCSVSISSTDVSETISSGSGGSFDLGVTHRPFTLPECLHGSITLANATMNATATATATATITSGTNWPGSAANEADIATAQGSVTPASLGATSPAEVPASGYGAYSYNFNLYADGFSVGRVRIFDFSKLSP